MLEVVKDSGVVTQQLSTVVLFVIVFLYTLENTISETMITMMGIGLVMIGVVIRLMTDINFSVSTCFKGINTLLLLFGSIYSLSPVLRTLTKSISDDTIVACTYFLFLLHILLHDYSYVNGSTSKFGAPVSLNAAIFASVLLASRLPSNFHVYALISLAIEAFSLFPIFRHHLKRYSEQYHHFLTSLMVLLCITGLYPISAAATVIYIASVVFITVGCPFWLIFIQKYKNAINGPWDEAVPVTRFE